MRSYRTKDLVPGNESISRIGIKFHTNPYPNPNHESGRKKRYTRARSPSINLNSTLSSVSASSMPRWDRCSFTTEVKLCVVAGDESV